jgi:hypothetical protein
MPCVRAATICSWVSPLSGIVGRAFDPAVSSFQYHLLQFSGFGSKVVDSSTSLFADSFSAIANYPETGPIIRCVSTIRFDHVHFRALERFTQKHTF